MTGALLLEKARCEPTQVFELNFGALNEVFGSVLDEYHPAKRGNREKGQPEHPTKIPHLPIVRVRGFDRNEHDYDWKAATKGMLFRGQDTTVST